MGNFRDFLKSSSRKAPKDSQVAEPNPELVQTVIKKVYYVDRSTITDLNITHGEDAPRIDDSIGQSSQDRTTSTPSEISTHNSELKAPTLARVTEKPTVALPTQSIKKISTGAPEEKPLNATRSETTSTAGSTGREKRESNKLSDLVSRSLRERIQAQEKRKSEKETIRFLQQNKFDITAKDFSNDKALHWAATNGHIAAVEFLLNRGAKASTKDGSPSKTALSKAAKNNHTQVVQLLLDHGVDMAVELELSETAALCEAAKAGHLEILQLLLMKWPDVPSTHGASRDFALIQGACSGHEDVVGLLIEKGGRAATVYGSGRETALSLAATNGNLGSARLLLEHGADPDVMTGFPGKTSCALHMATIHRWPDVVRLLLEWGADVDMRNTLQQTPLHVAASNRFQDVLEVLIEKEADPTLFDADRRQPLYCAIANGHGDAVKALFATNTINELPPDGENISCLQRAIDGNHIPVIRVLVEQGVDVKSSLEDRTLGMAAKKGNLELVRVLLDIGFFKEARDERGRTALHLAAENGHIAVVGLLLERGASGIAKNKHGTPAHYWAKQNGHHEVAQMLERHRKSMSKTSEGAVAESSARAEPRNKYTGWGSGGMERQTKWEKEGYTDPMHLRWA